MIKCQVCGGTTVLIDGILHCENCGNKQQIISYFDNIEVFLDCIENDRQGRRTKDSIVAQDLYFKLERKKINVFFKRLSVADVVDSSQNEKCCNTALNSAKIVLLVSTCKENFEHLIENTQNFFDDKIIVPICSGSNASIIPKEISKYQALNYDTIGAINDLISLILNHLEKKQELNIANVMIKNSNKRKLRIIITTSIILFTIIIFGLYLVFSSPYVLKSKKYEYANSLAEENRFAEAIKLYSELNDYKNSSDIKKNLYSQYEGYYSSETEDLLLQLDINNDFVSNIEITLLQGQSQTIINSSANVNVNRIDFFFSDSSNSQGKGIIKLKDQEIELTIKYFSANSDFEETHHTFNISNKKDIPIINNVTSDEIVKWMSESKRQSDFGNMGYNLIFSGNTYKSNQQIFQVENTDVYLVIFNQTYTKIDNIFQKVDVVKDGYVYALKAPASLLIPEYIGKQFKEFEKDNIFYCVDPIFLDLEQDGIYCQSVGNDMVIEENTMIGAIPKNWVSENNWNNLIYNMPK